MGKRVKIWDEFAYNVLEKSTKKIQKRGAHHDIPFFMRHEIQVGISKVYVYLNLCVNLNLSIYNLCISKVK